MWVGLSRAGGHEEGSEDRVGGVSDVSVLVRASGVVGAGIAASRSEFEGA